MHNMKTKDAEEMSGGFLLTCPWKNQLVTEEENSVSSH